MVKGRSWPGRRWETIMGQSREIDTEQGEVGLNDEIMKSDVLPV
jgi:hypothetical protein